MCFLLRFHNANFSHVIRADTSIITDMICIGMGNQTIAPQSGKTDNSMSRSRSDPRIIYLL